MASRRRQGCWRSPGLPQQRYGHPQPLGDTRHALGDPTSGRADWQRALDILTALDHPDAAAVRAKLQLP
ncbi:hypothetical protein [Micromonospora sp. NPDC005237]|uniref:hypothetical protein n=1 Tax=Micromonospora sp. NPDC005237 TaxID=3155113 RepID=UPI0033BC9A39